MDFKISNNFDLSNIKKYVKKMSEQINYKYDDNIYNQNDPSQTAPINEYLETENIEANKQDVANIFENNEIASNAAMAVGGFANGVGNFGENVVDAGATGVTALATPFTWLYDQFTGSNVTEEMWNNSNAFVAEEHVNSAFEDFYTNNEIGKSMNENASEAMQYGNVGYNTAVGVGYLTATVASAGGVSQVSALGMVGSGSAISGIAGFGKGTSQALNDGATTQEALIAGELTGLWEAGQWAFGAKIAGKGFTTVALDMGSGAVDPVARSGIQMIYNDQGFVETLEQNGGVEGILSNAAIAGGFSSLGEISTLKSGHINKKSDVADTNLNMSSIGKIANNENTSYWIQNGNDVSPSQSVLENFVNSKVSTEEARIQLRPMFEDGFPEMQKMQINGNTAATFERLYNNPNIDVGIHNVGYASKENINDILTNGLIMTEDSMSGGAMPSPNKIPDYTNNVFRTSTLYEGLLMTSRSYKGSHSEIVIAIPSGTKYNDPSLYFWDNNIGYYRLKPEYIVGYVPVDDSGKIVGEITRYLN